MIITAITNGSIKDESTVIKLCAEIGISMFEATNMWEEAQNEQNVFSPTNKNGSSLKDIAAKLFSGFKTENDN